MAAPAPQRRYYEPEHERADPSTMRALQRKKLQALLDVTWARNPFYRDHWQAAGVRGPEIGSIEDFGARFPVVRKRDFVADQDQAPPFGRRQEYALTLGDQLVVCTTSGTTGQGVEVHAQTASERHTANKVYGYLFCWAGLKRGDSVFLNYPVTLLGGGRIELNGLEAYGLTVYPVGNYDVHRKADLLRRFRPAAVMATTSYLDHLAAVLGDDMPLPGLQVLFGGGEGGGYSWLERLQAQWRVPLFNHFGATQTRVDLMFPCERAIGSRDHPAMLHNIDPYFLLEVIDPATGRHVAEGEAGEIVVTSLFHQDVPLIRCAMSDRAVYRTSAYCPCRRPFSGIEIGTISRIDDMKKIKGINVWPQAVDDVMFGTPEVDEYQIMLTSTADQSDAATARIMPKRPMMPSDAAALAESIAGRLRQRIGIRFQVEMLPPGALARSEYKARRWIDQRARMETEDA